MTEQALVCSVIDSPLRDSCCTSSEPLLDGYRLAPGGFDRVRRAYPQVNEAVLACPHRIDGVAAVGDVRRVHDLAQAVEVQLAKLIPLRGDDHRVGVARSLIRVALVGD